MSLEFPIRFRYDPFGFRSAEKDIQQLTGRFSDSQRSLVQLQSLMNRTRSLYASSLDENRMKGYSVMIERVKKRMNELEASTRSLKNTESSLQSFTGKFATSYRSMSQLQALMSRTRAQFDKATDIKQAKRYGAMIGEIEKKMKELEKSTGSCATKTSGFLGKLSNFTGMPKLGLIGAAAGAITRRAFGEASELVNSAGQVERYQSTLKTLLQSRSGASERMSEYFDIAKTTPFGLSEVVEAGNKLQSLGQYSRKNLIMLGDLAAASGKPLEQVMTAFSQLATGQKGDAARMFRDLLITQDDWIKATGKGVSRQGELLATTKEMLEALPKIMKRKNFAGMMAEQSQNTEGKISNLQDSIEQLKVSMGERLLPVTNRVVGVLSRVVDGAKRYVEIPSVQKIAAEKVEVNRLMKELIEHNDKQDRRAELIETIQRKYPEILKNLDLEKTSTAQLRDRLKEVNTEYDNMIRKTVLAGMVEKLQERFKDKMDYVTAYETSQYVARESTRLGQEKLAMKDKYGIGSYNVRDDGTLFYYKNGVPTNVSISKWGADQQQEWMTKTAEQQALEEMTKYANPFMTREKAAKAKRAAEAYQKSIESLNSQIESLLPKTGIDTTPPGGNGGNGGGGGGGGGDDGANDREQAITGGGPKTVTINIGKFLDSINLYPQNLTEGAKDIEQRLLEMFGRVVAQGGYSAV